MKNNLKIQIYCDGDEPLALSKVTEELLSTWDSMYGKYGSLEFLPIKNLKQNINTLDLLPHLKRIERIRNPDIFFTEVTQGIELGGIEITTHSPDGSNIEKRYPFLWVSGRTKSNAFVATPYLKRRPGGQINRFPHRHAKRNLDFLDSWVPEMPDANFLRQFVPIVDLHGGDIELVPPQLKSLLMTWQDMGRFFSHYLAIKAIPEVHETAASNLSKWKHRLKDLVDACMNNTQGGIEASTLFRDEDRWIQVYNCRPDSGHWERGEGQFDSIDGRLMFTLDTISLLPKATQPRLEFWLPQMVSTHPWIAEQKRANYGSKRLRNILIELASEVKTKFADELSVDDWELLKNNQESLLERLDWSPDIHSISKMMEGQNAHQIATAGISQASRAELQAIEELLKDSSLYYCAYRVYNENWQGFLEQRLEVLPKDAVVLAPRIPQKLLLKVPCPSRVKLIPAEMCTRIQLRMLRQIHRAKLHVRE